jgi:RES domain-containing protein
MVAWRLAKAAHSQLDGAGGLHGPGRWNHKVYPIVYSAASVSLAALELRVHLKTPPLDYVLMEIWIPGDVPVLPEDSLPENWQDHLESTRNLGSEWLRSRSSVALSVPSAVVPFDRNYLLNPAHPDFPLVRVSEIRSFRFDLRLYEP